MSKKWYGVHTYSGFENKVRLNLLERIKNEEVEEYFEEILIPSETVVELKKGEKKTSSRKLICVRKFSFHLSSTQQQFLKESGFLQNILLLLHSLFAQVN